MSGACADHGRRGSSQFCRNEAASSHAAARRCDRRACPRGRARDHRAPCWMRGTNAAPSAVSLSTTRPLRRERACGSRYLSSARICRLAAHGVTPSASPARVNSVFGDRAENHAGRRAAACGGPYGTMRCAPHRLPVLVDYGLQFLAVGTRSFAFSPRFAGRRRMPVERWAIFSRDGLIQKTVEPVRASWVRGDRVFPPPDYHVAHRFPAVRRPSSTVPRCQRFLSRIKVTVAASKDC